MPRGRGKTSRARARKVSAVEPGKPEEPEVQSDEQPGHPERKYPIVLPVPVIYSLRSQCPQSPKPKLLRKWRASNLTVNMGEKTLTVMKTQYLRPRPMRYLPIHSLAKMIHEWVHRSLRSHQSYHKVTHHRQVQH